SLPPTAFGKTPENMATRPQTAPSRETTRADSADRPQRARRPLLQPRGMPGRLGRSMAGHPVRAYLIVAVVGFAVLAGLAVAAGGGLPQYALSAHGVGHAHHA